VVFQRLSAADHLLPVQKKNKKCASSGLSVVLEGQKSAANLKNLPTITLKNWFRTGHGRGIKSSRLEEITGHPLHSLLELLCPDSGPGDFFLFVACDGYRTILSWEEIFETRDGSRMMLVVDRNPDREIQDLKLTCGDDFFVDRNVWGLSHMQHIRHQLP
jgi:hypothetical protein